VIHAACRSGEFYTSDDAGDSWRPLSLGLKIDDLSSLALTQGDPAGVGRPERAAAAAGRRSRRPARPTSCISKVPASVLR
jgi:hypothetical protein